MFFNYNLQSSQNAFANNSLTAFSVCTWMTYITYTCQHSALYSVSRKKWAPKHAPYSTKLSVQLPRSIWVIVAKFYMIPSYHLTDFYRYCDEISVRPSVRLSVTHVDCDKTEERSVQIYIPYERTFILVLWEEEWLVGGDHFYVTFWVNRPPLERNCRFSTNNRS